MPFTPACNLSDARSSVGDQDFAETSPEVNSASPVVDNISGKKMPVLIEMTPHTNNMDITGTTDFLLGANNTDDAAGSSASSNIENRPPEMNSTEINQSKVSSGLGNTFKFLFNGYP